MVLSGAQVSRLLAPTPPTKIRKANVSRIPNSSLDCFQMSFGMTEIAIALSSMPEEDLEHALETVGYVADHVEVSNRIMYVSKRHYKRPFCNVGCC